MKEKKLNTYEISVVVIAPWRMVVVCYWRRADVRLYVNFWLTQGKLTNRNERLTISPQLSIKSTRGGKSPVNYNSNYKKKKKFFLKRKRKSKIVLTSNTRALFWKAVKDYEGDYTADRDVSWFAHWGSCQVTAINNVRW